MPNTKGYTTRPPEWWIDLRVEAARRFIAGDKQYALHKELDGEGKRLFPSNSVLDIVREAVKRGETPLHDFYLPKDSDKGDAQPPDEGHKPQGALLVGQVRPRVVQLDERLFLLYDLARIVFPDYNATEGEWIFQCVKNYYLEHGEQLELNRLFPGIGQVQEGFNGDTRTEEAGHWSVTAEEAVSPV